MKTDKVMNSLSRIFTVIGAGGILIIFVVTGFDVVMNKIFNAPFPGATEIITSAMPISVFGFLLAEGSYRAAEKWGPAALERVIHAKKQEYPGYESRRSFATGFSLVTSNRGACHLRAAMYVNEIFAGEFEKDGFESHMTTLVEKEHFLALADSYLTCKFGMRNAQYTMPVLAELYRALTGIALSEEELMQAGERIWNLERLYNLREGAEADMPAPRLFQENLDDGQKAGEAISKERFLKARGLYYTARGWSEAGVPLAEKLKELGLAG